MALKKDLTVSNIPVTDAYIRIYNIHGNKNGMEIEVEYLADADSPSFDRQTFDFVPDLASADNFLKQAYIHLKTLEDFAGSVNV